MRIRVKICGITNLEDAKAAVEMGADALGFVFYKKSPRRISVKDAKYIIENLPPFVERIGIFVNERKEIVKKIIKKCNLSAVQFHGDETPQYCTSFKGIKIIKAIRVRDKKSFKETRSYKNVDAILLDAFEDRRFGGTGRTFNWQLIRKNISSKLPIILSGGIRPDNVGLAIRMVSPYAIDTSSGIESRPGKKSTFLMQKFFDNVKFCLTKNKKRLY